MDLSDLRKEYTRQNLRRADLSPDPLQLFGEWFQHASENGIHEPNAMTLATISPAGHPQQRTVLLKSFDQRGLTFFTNYQSRKAVHIATNPKVSALFPWVALERQVIISGSAEKTTTEESLEYFLTRPRESQIGAWVSHQSQPIPSRDYLVEKFDELRQRFENQTIPLPPHWGGFLIIPESIEFWQGGPGRLHDRFLYTRENDQWKIERLSP